MSVPARPARISNVTAALAADRLGVAQLVAYVVSAATPLTVIAGVVTLGYATAGLPGIPVAFAVIAVLLGLFAVGYVAMARRMSNAGAFYAYIAAGLGKPLGVGAAWVAVAAYTALTCGLYGAIGAAATPLLHAWLGVPAPWWLIAMLAWLVVAVMGTLQVDLNGRLLAVLLCAEVGIILVFSAASVAHPAGGAVTFATLNPAGLFAPGVGALLCLAVLGFIGFEATVVFSEEAKDPRRTVPRATYLSLALIAGLYTFAAWALSVATGADRIVAESQAQGTELLFTLAGAHLGPAWVHIGHALFVTSLLAAMVSFHNTTARYLFALGRERVLPAVLGRTSIRSGAPLVASLGLSAVSVLVIAGYAGYGRDPLVELFYWAGTSGAVGILILIAATSVAVVAYFARHPRLENAWRTAVAPITASILLAGVAGLTLANLDTLLGVPADHPLRWAVPGAYLAAAVAGTGWGLILRATRPDVYAGIGLGAKSVTATLPAHGLHTPGTIASRPGVRP